jgi:nitroreductase
MHNPTIDLMLSHRSVRKFTAEQPTDEVLQTIARAGQQAAFASQLYSVILSRKKKQPFGAPVMFTICVDLYRLERFMKLRGWDVVTNDVSMLLFGIQDAAYMAQNMVLAAESLGLGTCFLGGAPYDATRIAKRYKLPKRVMPIVRLVMGYPAEDNPPRPRFPLSFTMFEDEYPELTDEQVAEAMQVMDDGYMAQEYYRKPKIMIKLEGEREETYTYDNYSWTEHISRKWGQWFPSPNEILEVLKERGFDLSKKED